MKRVALTAALCLTLSLAPTAFAWNNFGHMTVAAVAYSELTPTARAKATRLLKLNPSYPQWIDGVPEADRDEVAFLVAATWADQIKHANGYKNDGDRPSGPDASRNIGYIDKLQHRYWHYIDEPFSPDHTALMQPVAPNAQTQIAAFRQTLASPTASDRLKSYDLAWLLHLVGDVHQPLHATSRFTHDQPNGDAGGNFVALCPKPCKKELHAFWDDAVGKGKQPAAAIRAADRLRAADPALVVIDDESKWVAESFTIAEHSVYAPPVGVGAGPFMLDTAYEKTARRIARERVALAGARLARLLNESLR